MKGVWSCLNLAFLDPEGLELEWQTVEKLGQMKTMDLIINFPISGLRRNLAQFVDAINDTVVDNFFGGREWRDLYREHRGGSIPALPFIELYQQKLEGLGYVRGDEGTGYQVLIRNSREAPLYYLLLAGKHDIPGKFWNEVTRRGRGGQLRFDI